MASELLFLSLQNLFECSEEVQWAHDEIHSDFASLSDSHFVPDACFMGPLWHFCTAWHCLAADSLPESIFDAFSHKVPKLSKELTLVDLLTLAQHATKKPPNLQKTLAQLQQCRQKIDRASHVIKTSTTITPEERIAMFQDILNPLIMAWHAERQYDLPSAPEHLLPNWDGEFELVSIPLKSS